MFFLFLFIQSEWQAGWNQMQKSVQNPNGFAYQIERQTEGDLANGFPHFEYDVFLLIQNGKLVLGSALQDKKEVRIESDLVFQIEHEKKQAVQAGLVSSGTYLFDEMIFPHFYLLNEFEKISSQGQFVGTKDIRGEKCHEIALKSGVLHYKFFLSTQTANLSAIYVKSPDLLGDNGIWLYFKPIKRSSEFTPLEGYELNTFDAPEPKIGADLSHLFFEDFSGESVHLSQFKGQPLILDFWATWCSPCLPVMNHLQNFSRHKKDVAVLGVNVQERKNPQLWLKRQKIDYKQVKGDEFYNTIQQPGLPFMIVLDREGRVVSVLSGYHGELTFQALEKAVSNL